MEVAIFQFCPVFLLTNMAILAYGRSKTLGPICIVRKIAIVRADPKFILLTNWQLVRYLMVLRASGLKATRAEA